MKVSLVLGLNYGDRIRIVINPQKSDNDDILSFDIKAAQRVYINLVSVRISEDLLIQKQLLKKKVDDEKRPRASVYRFLNNCLTEKLNNKYLLHSNWCQQF